jgi:hypothetical protein
VHCLLLWHLINQFSCIFIICADVSISVSCLVFVFVLASKKYATLDLIFSSAASYFIFTSAANQLMTYTTCFFFFFILHFFSSLHVKLVRSDPLPSSNSARSGRFSHTRHTGAAGSGHLKNSAPCCY